jgi:hypothetical protein
LDIRIKIELDVDGNARWWNSTVFEKKWQYNWLLKCLQCGWNVNWQPGHIIRGKIKLVTLKGAKPRPKKWHHLLQLHLVRLQLVVLSPGKRKKMAKMTLKLLGLIFQL